MDKDERELVGRLFAMATVVLEHALAAAVNGQSPKLKPETYEAQARFLRNAVNDAAIFAEAAAIVARRSVRERTR